MKKVVQKIWVGGIWETIFPETATDFVKHLPSGKTLCEELELLEVYKEYTDSRLKTIDEEIKFIKDNTLTEDYKEYIDNKFKVVRLI